MQVPLIATKFSLPPLRKGAVSRLRLLEKLNHSIDAKLTLISASAGFGKTTLVLAWLQTLIEKGEGKRIAWFALDESDNDPARFWNGVVLALQSVWPGVGQEAMSMFKSAQPVPIEAILTVLVNEIAALAKEDSFFLVFDDFHVVTTPQILTAFTFLLEHLPAGLHLVATTRVDPSLPLPRLRARHQLIEIRTDELRFTSVETAAFLNQCMGLNLSEADIDILEARTEGWIAGVQMAALSMQNAPDTTEFIRLFTGSNRYILEYLLDEVLQREPDEVQTFLLETSILDRLCSDLCEAVTGKQGGQRLLEHLENANLFIVPLDYERHWYRYHPLFGELLRIQMERTNPETFAALHRKAAEWYEPNGYFEEAVQHLLVIKDFDRAARLIERVAFDLLDRGEIGTLVAWLRLLPAETVRTRPWLCVLDAWMLILTGQAEAIEIRLQDTESAIQTVGLPPAQTDRIRAYISAIRAQVSFIQGGAPAAIEFAKSALNRLSGEDHVIGATTATILGAGYAYIADFSSAVVAFEKARSVSLAGGNQFNAMVAGSALAQIAVVQGRLRDAYQIYQDGLRVAGKSAFLAPGYTYAGLANVLCERNEMDTALQYASQSVELCKLIGQAEILMTAYTSLARVLCARREFDAALDTLEEARRVASEISAWSLDTIQILQARVWLAKGDLESAILWSQTGGYSIEEPASFHREQGLLTLARIRMAQRQHDQIVAILERLRQEAEGSGRSGSLIEIYILQALNFEARADTQVAFEALGKALALARSEGYQRIFLDEGEAMRGLLLKYRKESRLSNAYLDRLLSAFSGKHPAVSAGQEFALVEPLSERELEVLRMLAAGRSNPEIAGELYVSLNTVKAHVKSIFAKLETHNRTQATQRARDLRLI